MSATDVRDAVREQLATELSRLGSSKALYAATEGELESEAVLHAAADAELAAADTFAAWAEAEPDDRAAATFATTAEEERDHYETVLAELDDHEPVGSVPGLPAHLRSVEGTIARAGALLGRVLVADESKSQYVGYFVGNADPQTAGVFRELRGDLDEQEERALELLETLCETENDWTAAELAALDAVEAAYEFHVETLESLGVDPKPVC